MQQIRRDTVKIARHNKLNIDTMHWNVDTSFVQSNRESFQAVIAVAPKPLKPRFELSAFDTIQPCDVSLLQAGTYYIPKSQPVRNTAEMETPMDYNILANGIVLTFTLLMTMKYAMNCIPAWTNLIQDLRKVVSL